MSVEAGISVLSDNAELLIPPTINSCAALFVKVEAAGTDIEDF